MDRRRFLKYAAVGAAVLGSALAGYEFDRWQSAAVPPSLDEDNNGDPDSTPNDYRDSKTRLSERKIVL